MHSVNNSIPPALLDVVVKQVLDFILYGFKMLESTLWTCKNPGSVVNKGLCEDECGRVGPQLFFPQLLTSSGSYRGLLITSLWCFALISRVSLFSLRMFPSLSVYISSFSSSLPAVNFETLKPFLSPFLALFNCLSCPSYCNLHLLRWLLMNHSHFLPFTCLCGSVPLHWLLFS